MTFKVLPDEPLARRLVVQSLLYSIGAGVFLAGSTVFFTVYADLPPVTIGLGLSTAALFSTLASVPMGRLADHIGHKRSWCASALLESAVFACYPFLGSAVPFIVAVSLLGVNEAFGSAARTGYTLNSFDSDKAKRIEALAYTRSALNVGFSIGAGACGLLLLLTDRSALVALPLSASILMLANGLFIARLPAVQVAGASAAIATAPPAGKKRRSVLRKIHFMKLSVVNGICGLHDIILTVVLPLWVLDRTDAPQAVVAGLLLANTGLVILLQVPASRGAESLVGATNLLKRSARILAVAVPFFVGSYYSSGWTTIVMIAMGVVVLTWSELSQAAGAWGIVAELTPTDGRGAYQGAWRLGTKLTQAAAPALLTLLIVRGAPFGWAAFGVLLVLTSMVAPRAVRAAEREFALDLSQTDEPDAEARRVSDAT